MSELKHVHKQRRGWLLPYLLTYDISYNPEKDFKGHGRWAYWLLSAERGQVPEEPIPQIRFRSTPHTDDEDHVKEVLEVYVHKEGRWYDYAWIELVKWILYGLGDGNLKDDVERIAPEIRDTWYTLFDLGHLLRSPIDWSAYVLEGRLKGMGSRSGNAFKHAGFFATPIDVTLMMAEMTMGFTDPEIAKVQTVCDPCCGTGSMLLAASNYSLRLYGQDIVHDLVLCTKLNGWLWAPWMVHTPSLMLRTFQVIDRQRSKTSTPSPSPGIVLETDPKRVEATKAYRAGRLTQADFFGALNLSQS